MTPKPIIVDGHLDLAFNMLTYGRDYTRPASETRRREVGSAAVAENGDTLIGWPELQSGNVAVAFATLFAKPSRSQLHHAETQVYRDFDHAYRLAREQLSVYHRLEGDHPDMFRIIRSTPELRALLDLRRSSPDGSGPVGLVIGMEGAEAIRSPSELDEWHALGMRWVGLAWVGTRYSGGWKEPGPLTQDGRALLRGMADLGFILDISHMDEPAALAAIDQYQGTIVATHGNCHALLPGYPTNRQFTDRLIEGVLERDGVVGVVPYNAYLKVGWTRESSTRDEVGLAAVIDHIDHVCQLAGDADHAGIGSDFDGGFGLQSAPAEIDTIADLQKLAPLLKQRGYADGDVAKILGENWLRCLRRGLPPS